MTFLVIGLLVAAGVLLIGADGPRDTRPRSSGPENGSQGGRRCALRLPLRLWISLPLLRPWHWIPDVLFPLWPVPGIWLFPAGVLPDGEVFRALGRGAVGRPLSGRANGEAVTGRMGNVKQARPAASQPDERKD